MLLHPMQLLARAEVVQSGLADRPDHVLPSQDRDLVERCVERLRTVALVDAGRVIRMDGHPDDHVRARARHLDRCPRVLDVAPDLDHLGDADVAGQCQQLVSVGRCLPVQVAVVQVQVGVRVDDR